MPERDTPPPLRKRRASLEDSLGAPVYTDRPQPPFTFAIHEHIWCCFAIDRSRVAPLLPSELLLSDENVAFLALYRAGHGWGLSKFTAGFVSVAVADHPSPDTAEACWIMLGHASNGASDLLAANYGEHRPGAAEVQREGDDIKGWVWSEQGDVVAEATLRLTGAPPEDMGSVDRYLGRDRNGELVSSFVTVSGLSRPAELISLRFTEHADPRLQALSPTRLLWALYVPLMLTNWSAPEPLLPAEDSAAGRASREALMAILDGQGRACCIVRANGTVLHRNAEAVRLLAGEPLALRQNLRLSEPVAQLRLSDALAAASEGRAGDVGQHVILPRREAGPLVLQVAPLDPVLAGPGTALVLLFDPAQPHPQEDVDLLQLLGLTRAEARIASAVGRGLPPREAAERLDLTENTVRSTLKVVYDKLGITRQADLVRIVSRLGFG